MDAGNCTEAAFSSGEPESGFDEAQFDGQKMSRGVHFYKMQYQEQKGD
jgi:hypothetical protein